MSRRLGYDGVERHFVRGRRVVTRRLRLNRASWHSRQAVPVEISRLPECQSLFGLTE
jgi:hypothetical protein